jgi:tripartite-type tricarboxylate transporter receptor subunit TctC
MVLRRRQFISLAASTAALLPVSGLASAQDYPHRPITIIVPGAGGGVNDAVTRVVAERMRKPLGQPVIIENIGGAEGGIATSRVVRARPDGYTMLATLMTIHVLSSALYSLQYDPLNDFAPVSLLAAYPPVLVSKRTIPANDLKELIAWLKTNTNKASAASATPGARLLWALLQKETGTHFPLVPYRGGAQQMQDLMSGQIDLAFVTPFQLPLVRDASIKAFAVATGTRLTIAPDIPTFYEMGLPAMSMSSWIAFFAPKGTPRDIVTKVNDAAADALADRAVRSRLTDLGVEIFPRDQQMPEVLSAQLKADAAKWLPLIKELGIKGQ